VALYSGKYGELLAHVEGDRDCAGLGWSLTRIDDLDGDGHPDLLAGALHRYADVLSGKDLHRIRRIDSRNGYGICDAFASSLDVLGDVDYDCVPDWIVGANEDAMGFDEGYAWVVSGRTGRVLGETCLSSDEGVDACGIGDVDLDGVPDIALATETKFEDQESWYSAYKTGPVKQTRRIRVISGRTWETLWQVDARSLRESTIAASDKK